MTFFRFFPLPGAQNHVKTTVFEHRQDRRRGRRGARNTVKNDVFEPYTQNTWKITGCKCDRGSFQGRPKVDPRSGQGRSAAGGVHAYNLRLPPKASGEHTGPGPAPGFKGCRPCRRPRTHISLLTQRFLEQICTHSPGPWPSGVLLGAGAFWGISRSVSETAGLVREAEQ